MFRRAGQVAAQTKGSRMLAACQAMAPAGVTIRYAWTAQKGMNPNWRFLSWWLLLANKGRIVAVTSDRRIALYDAGRFKFNFRKPPKVLFVVTPDQVDFGTLRGAWSKITVGPEQMWAPRKAYQIIQRAAQENGIALAAV